MSIGTAEPNLLFSLFFGCSGLSSTFPVFFSPLFPCSHPETHARSHAQYAPQLTTTFLTDGRAAGAASPSGAISLTESTSSGSSRRGRSRRSGAFRLPPRTEAGAW